MRNVRRGAVSVAAAVLVIGCAQPQEVGRGYYAAKNYPAAIEAYKQANAEEPNKPSTLKGLADAYFANGQYPEAIEWYLKTRSLNPLDTSIACNLGGAYYYLGRYEEALAVFESANVDGAASVSGAKEGRLRALRGAPSGGPSACAQMRETVYEKTGRYDIAIAQVKKQIDADPRGGEPFMKLAELYVKNGQYDEAVVAAKRAIDLLPASADAHHVLGAAYWKKKEYPAAIGSLAHARDLNPKNGVTAVLLAKSYVEVGEVSRAIGMLRKAKMDAPSAAVDFELARALYLSGGYAESKAVLDVLVDQHRITGIGIEFEGVNGSAIVRSVRENSPAARAGIRAGDRIVQIDQQPIADLGNEQIAAKIRGPENTAVKLTLRRGGESFESALMRETFFASQSAPVFALRSLVGRKLHDSAAADDARKAYGLDPAEGALAMAASAFERGDMAGTLRYASALKEDSHARIFEAAVYARGGNATRAMQLLKEIAPRITPSSSAPLREEKAMLLQALSAAAEERSARAAESEQSAQFGAALEAYADVLLLSRDEAQASAARSAMFRVAALSAPVLPEEAHRHIVRGEFFVGEANFQEALNEFQKALVSAPYVARLYFNVALVEAKLNRYPDAMRSMALYLEASPDAPDARAAKDEMIKWEILMNKPREYPHYEGSAEGAAAEPAIPVSSPAGGRGIGR